MNLIIEGVLFGLSLALLLGPIFVALTQTSLEKGLRAGLTVGLGIWISDLIIITLSYFFIRSLANIIENEDFRFWMGAVGGAIMIAFGLVILLNASKIEISEGRQQHGIKNYIGFWLKGFLINTINPFTFIFWLGVNSTYVITRKISSQEAFTFLGTILLVIIITDSLKVYLAKALKKKLQLSHIQWMNKIAGICLFIFGVYLIYRVW